MRPMKLVWRSGTTPVPDPYAAEPGTAESPVPGSRAHPVPRPQWVRVFDGGGNQDQGDEPGSGSPAAPGTEPEPGTAGTGDLLGLVLQYARELVLQASRAAGSSLLRLAETPRHPLNHLWQYKPMSLAEQHAHANSHERGRFQLHTAGKMLTATGNGLSALGSSAAGQWIALAVIILAAIAITVLVL